MTGDRISDRWRVSLADFTWMMMRGAAIAGATMLNKIGVHKQDANRGLEPYMVTDIIVSATNFQNFYLLRNHPDAQPAIRDAAAEMQEIDDNTPAKWLQVGDWHKPWEHESIASNTSRAASISYFNHDRSRTEEERLKSFVGLITATPVHSSPLEHCAMAILPGMVLGNTGCRVFDVHNFTQQQLGRDYLNYSCLTTKNFAGFLQARQLLEIGAIQYLYDESLSIDESSSGPVENGAN
jgi:hypothetical protein